MNDFDNDFEHELHASRPAPRGELLDSLVSKITARPAPVRKSRWQLRFAAVMSAAALLALAGLGGVSAASNAVSKHSSKGASHGDDGKGGGHGEDGDDEGEGRHDGKDESDHNGKTVPVCLNGSTSVRYFKPKKAFKIVLIKHRGVFATGNPPSCPVV
jgi:hypothetical protein